ncbi:MAG TPA: hypothetical protein VIE65_12495 [Methylobacter sp.]|jgi:hypothetical protein
MRSQKITQAYLNLAAAGDPAFLDNPRAKSVFEAFSVTCEYADTPPGQGPLENACVLGDGEFMFSGTENAIVNALVEIYEIMAGDSPIVYKP